MTAGERIAAIEACEQRLVNLWPAVDTLIWGDWVVRCAHGYSGRANSASALRPGADLDNAAIEDIAQLYHGAGLQPAIRLTPLAAPGLARRLLAQGWRLRTRSVGMLAAAPFPGPADAAVALAPSPDAGWLAGATRWQEESKRNPAHLNAIVSRIRTPAVFATLTEDGARLAFGMAALDRGMAEIGSIIVDPAARGRGLGRRLVGALLGWAGGSGASRAFLQVEAGNAAARALYASLGFADLYDYSEVRL